MNNCWNNLSIIYLKSVSCRCLFSNIDEVSFSVEAFVENPRLATPMTLKIGVSKVGESL